MWELLLDSAELPRDKVIKTQGSGLWIWRRKGEKGEPRAEWVMDHQGAVKLRIPAFPLPTHPDAGKEMLFVFIRMCDFLSPFLFGSSCMDQDKDLEGLWHRLRLPAESLSLCPAATQPYGWRKTSQRRGYSRNATERLQFSSRTEHQSAFSLRP